MRVLPEAYPAMSDSPYVSRETVADLSNNKHQYLGILAPCGRSSGPLPLMVPRCVNYDKNPYFK